MRADGKDREKLENALTICACLIIGIIVIIISIARGGLK